VQASYVAVSHRNEVLMPAEQLTLLCLSHLKWNHVWQRPQQLMSRFAERCRVLYVDPPEIVAGNHPPFFEDLLNEHGVGVLRPVFPAGLLDTPGHTYKDFWQQLLPSVLDLAGPDTIFWVFSPLADYLAAAAQPQVKLIVYDCMDDLASFKDGTPEMRQRETNLLSLADLVFTGGRSMYEARKDRHERVSCFPSGVDVEHYQASKEFVPPAAVAGIDRPRLGYFGVLDERIDWPLIATIAAQRPDWQWVLVGPTAKVDPEELPHAPNIHYLGQQAYADLPDFLQSFDLAVMPFALNDATRFISPTKTLEYLAGGKPVISSSVPDVVATYRGIVSIEDGAAAWIEEIDRLLHTPATEHAARQQAAQPLLAQGSWDGIADRMWRLMQEQLRHE
jgi:glycosyltransferase involved in cell wall biosynthesis